jgi:hypothetical protein
MTCGILPSWSDFARAADASAAPEQWHGLAGCWCPALGQSGDKMLDLSGRRHHGTLANMDATAWHTGRDAWALRFDGADDFANLGDPEELRFSGAFTLVWYGYASSSGQMSSALLGKGGYAPQRACGVQLQDNTLYAIQAANGTTINEFGVAITRSYPAADMFVVTYESGRRLGVHHNGRLIGEKTSGVYAAFFNANGLPWCLMTRGDAAGKTAGSVLYAMMYQRALSSAEVASLAADPFALLRPRRRGRGGKRPLIRRGHLAAGQLFHSGAANGHVFNTGTVEGAIDA